MHMMTVLYGDSTYVAKRPTRGPVEPRGCIVIRCTSLNTSMNVDIRLKFISLATNPPILMPIAAPFSDTNLPGEICSFQRVL